VHDAIRKGDFWAGLFLAGLGAFIVEESMGWIYLGEEGPGAGFFPRWYGIAMVLLSLLMVAGAVFKGPPATRSRTVAWGEIRRAMGCWAALVVCIALLKVLGFLIAFSLLGWFLIAVMFRQPQKIALGVSVGGSLGFYLLFSFGLDLSLPGGMLF